MELIMNKPKLNALLVCYTVNEPYYKTPNNKLKSTVIICYLNTF